jgi:hypothetical protein
MQATKGAGLPGKKGGTEMTEKELIRAEIARYIREEVCSGYSSIACCRDLLKFIDSLPEVKPSRDLEEEVKRYYSDNFTYISSDQPTLSILTNVARHFAEWQKERMIKDAKEIITIQRSLTEPEFVKQRVIFLKEG